MLATIYRGHEQAGFFAHALMAQPAEPLLTRLPGNARSDDARYACLVPVRDYHRMLRQDTKGRGNGITATSTRKSSTTFAPAARSSCWT